MTEDLKNRITPLIAEFALSQYRIFRKGVQYYIENADIHRETEHCVIRFYMTIKDDAIPFAKIAIGEGGKFRLYQHDNKILLSFNAEILRMLYRVIEMLDNELERYKNRRNQNDNA